jgi:cysteine desulfurase
VLEACPEVAASTGSACHAGSEAPSKVLTAMGLGEEEALGAMRLSLGRGTTAEAVDRAAAALIAAWRRVTQQGRGRPPMPRAAGDRSR